MESELVRLYGPYHAKKGGASLWYTSQIGLPMLNEWHLIVVIIGRLDLTKVLARSSSFGESLNYTLPSSASRLSRTIQDICDSSYCIRGRVGSHCDHGKYISMLASSIFLDQKYPWQLYEGSEYFLYYHRLVVARPGRAYPMSTTACSMAAPCPLASKDWDYTTILDWMLVS